MESWSNVFPLRVMIVDNNIEFLESAAHLLRLQPNVEVVSCAVSESDAMEQLPHLQPNLVLISWCMSGLSTLDLTRLLKARSQAPYVVVFSMFDLPVYHTVAKEAGADGLICTSDWNVELFALLERLDQSSATLADSAQEK